MIQITKWERFQHYGKAKPPWIKLYRDTLTDYEFEQLCDADRWLLIGLWLLAAETGNQIPNDPRWLSRRLFTDDPVTADRLHTLQTLGFVEVGDSSRESLDKVYTKTETEAEEETDTSALADGENADVENLAWGDFAGWFRATGCKRLWGGVRPPSWSHNWSMGRDLSICKAIHEKEGVPLEDIQAIIERTDGPATMQRYHGSQNRSTRNALLGEVYKSQEPFGNLDIKVL